MIPDHVWLPESRIDELLACDNHRVLTVADLGSIDVGPFLCGKCRKPAKIVQNSKCPHGWDTKDCDFCFGDES